MTAEEEHIAITQVLAGNAQAYAALVVAYQDLAVATAFNILLNREDAEEVAQDAFVKAYQSLAQFKATAKFSSWFYRIVVNMALNKRKTRRTFDELAEDEPTGGPVADTYTDFSFLCHKDHRKYIQAALQQLAFNERLCLSLFYLNDLSAPEINEASGISVANVKVLLHRGRKNLYTALKQLLQDEFTPFAAP